MKPKRYRALHITPGLVDYTDGDQRETVLVKKPALDLMNPSFLGRPVFNFTHKVVDIKNAFDFTSEEIEEHAVGVISEVGYDVESGYYFVDMMIWDEETQNNIGNGYGVSNAYIPEVGEGGVYNNVPYDEEVTGGVYDHMAIVEDPRYGDVRIFENSNGKNPMKPKKYKINWPKVAKGPFKKNMAPEKKTDEEEEEMSLNADSVLMGDDGEEYPLAEMVEAYKQSNMDSNMDDEEGKPTLNMEDTVEIDGKQVSVKELYDNYSAKKNAEPPTDEALDSVVENEVKKNSAEVVDKTKPNANFMKLKANSEKGADPERIKINTERSRLKKGKALYGSVVQNEGRN